jgi:drug/metabolite transporter (DMT)-like permease
MRFAVGSIVLIFFTDIKNFIRNNSKVQLINWFLTQLILAISGRALYAYFSSSSLLSITPFEAVLISTSLPVLLIVLERFIFKNKFKNLFTPILSILSFATVLASIINYNSNKNFDLNRLSVGHFEMLIAMLFYAVHLIFYKKQVKDKSPANPLFIQFVIAFVLLFPFNIECYNSFYSLNFNDWFKFFTYSIVCNLLPFVLVHYCLKIYSSFTVGAVAILSPVCSFIFSTFYEQKSFDVRFVLLSILACLFTFFTVLTDQKSSFSKINFFVRNQK